MEVLQKTRNRSTWPRYTTMTKRLYHTTKIPSHPSLLLFYSKEWEMAVVQSTDYYMIKNMVYLHNRIVTKPLKNKTVKYVLNR